MKKNHGSKVGVSSARVENGTNKVKKAHTRVVCEKSSLEKDVLFGLECCQDARRTMKSPCGSCCDGESGPSEALVLLLM